MYSILEADGYTWPLNLLWSISISCRSENKMALLDLEWASPSWYLLKMLSRWLELGKIKQWAAFARSRTHPRGRIQGRAGSMALLQQAELEWRQQKSFLSGSPVAQHGSGRGGETGSVNRRSWYDPHWRSHTTQIFALKRCIKCYHSLQGPVEQSTNVGDGNSSFFPQWCWVGSIAWEALRHGAGHSSTKSSGEHPAKPICDPLQTQKGDVWSYFPREQL